MTRRTPISRSLVTLRNLLVSKAQMRLTLVPRKMVMKSRLRKRNLKRKSQRKTKRRTRSLKKNLRRRIRRQTPSASKLRQKCSPRLRALSRKPSILRLSALPTSSRTTYFQTKTISA